MKAPRYDSQSMEMEHLSITIIRLIGSLLALLFAWTVYRDAVRRQGRRFWWQRIPPKPPEEKDEYEALRSLIGGYFNQDWDIIEKTDDPDEVIVNLKKENSPEAIQNLIHDIERFLSKYGQSDTELNDALRRVFRPDIDFYNMKDRGTREGLEKVIEILSSPSKTP